MFLLRLKEHDMTARRVMGVFVILICCFFAFGQTPNSGMADQSGAPVAGARSHPEWLAVSDGDARKNLHKANENRNAGVAAYDQGKYDKAAALLQASLPLFQRQKLRQYVFVMLGDTFEKLGDFESAYDAYILASPSVVPSNRVVITGLPDERAREAAQSLLDSIQLCVACLEQARPYLGLAGIMRHFGRIAEAQAFEEEARIRKEADNAFDAVPAGVYSNESLKAMCGAAAAVYERENRPALAEAERAYAAQAERNADPAIAEAERAYAAAHEGDSIGSQANQTALFRILQALTNGMAAATGQQGGQAGGTGLGPGTQPGGQQGTPAPCLQHLGESCYTGEPGTLYFKGCIQVRDPHNSNGCVCYDKAKGQYCERMD
jgi:tetratricopeptide (TPR) repeat protein